MIKMVLDRPLILTIKPKFKKSYLHLRGDKEEKSQKVVKGVLLQGKNEEKRKENISQGVHRRKKVGS